MKLTKVAFVVAALVAGGSAMAQVAPQDGDSDLFVAFDNGSTSTSKAFDLGVSIAGFNFTQTQSFNVDLTGLGTPTGFVVEAANWTAPSGVNLAGDYIDISSAAPIATYNTVNNSGVGQGAQYLNQYIINTPMSNSLYANPGVTTAASYLSTAANNYWFGSTGGSYDVTKGNGISPSFNFDTSVSSSANFYQMLATDETPTDNATKSALGGAWSVSLVSGNTYQLTYTPSAVPLPAGVWLLLSGLTGLAAVRRRANAGAGVMAA
jgi:hypothetical protein